MSSTNGYKTFVVAGVGGLGAFIASELVKQGVTVYAFTRDSSKSLPEGVIAKAVDYDSEESLASALQGVDVVVSTLSGGGFGAQPALAKASKKAGVKLFVPSEFGGPTKGLTTGPLTAKTSFHGLLDQLGLPYVLIYTGPFLDWFFHSAWFGFDLPNKKFTIVGDGEKTISWTTRPDIARFTAYILTHLSLAQLSGKEIWVEGDRGSIKDVAKAFEEVKGYKIAFEYREVGPIKEKLGPDPRSFDVFADYLWVVWAEGHGAYTVPNSNSLYPGFKFESISDAVKIYY